MPLKMPTVIDEHSILLKRLADLLDQQLKGKPLASWQCAAYRDVLRKITKPERRARLTEKQYRHLGIATMYHGMQALPEIKKGVAKKLTAKAFGVAEEVVKTYASRHRALAKIHLRVLTNGADGITSIVSLRVEVQNMIDNATKENKIKRIRLPLPPET